MTHATTSLRGVVLRLSRAGYCTPCIHRVVLEHVAAVMADPATAPHMTTHLLDLLDRRRCECGPQ